MSVSSRQQAYFRCPSCGQIVYDPRMAMAEASHAAPCCGVSGEVRALWPHAAVRKFLHLAAGQDTADAEQRGIAIAALASALDILFECLMADIAAERRKEPDVYSLSFDERIAAFAALSGAPLVKLTGERFVSLWRTLHGLRSRLSLHVPHRDTELDEAAVIAELNTRTLPVFCGLHNSLGARPGAPVSSSPRQLKMLVVDDEEGVRHKITRILEKRGCQVICTESAEEALEKFSSIKPDCIFLDVMLPGMDGLSALLELKKIAPRVCVYFLTGIDGISFKARARELGAAGHLLKPVDAGQIKRICDELESK